VAELARGKTGRVYGHLMAMLTTMKGLPLSYNRDMQEDKEGLFDTVDTLNSTLEVLTATIGSLRIKGERTHQAAGESYSLATDIADYLVKKGIPFRQAHAIVGKLAEGCSTLEECAGIFSQIGPSWILAHWRAMLGITAGKSITPDYTKTLIGEPKAARPGSLFMI
jgi:argininosuccinate lyase